MSNIPSGVTPVITKNKLLRDQIIKIAGVPFQRLMVYKLEVSLPIPSEGLALFEIIKGFTIKSINTSTTTLLRTECNYVMQDVADGETIGIVTVRAGENNDIPMAVPDLPAGLGGPCKVFIKPISGIQSQIGSLFFQISVSGPPTISAGIVMVDNNNDGVPDDLAEEVLPVPGFELAGGYDDFYAGYTLGLAGGGGPIGGL